MQPKAIVLTAFACVLFSVALHAQTPSESVEPFGFKPGMTKAQIVAAVGSKSIQEDDGDLLVLSTAPKPHPDFDMYLVSLSSKTGVCKVQGVSKKITTNSFGEALEGKFKEFQEALVMKYGEPTKMYDFLHRGSIWSDDRDWMMGLLKDERTLAAFWEAVAEQPIILEQANAISVEAGTINVSYQFPCFATWKQEHDAKKNSVF